MSPRIARTVIAAASAVVCVLAAAVVAGPSQAVPEVGRDADVVREWNAIAVRTISTESVGGDVIVEGPVGAELPHRDLRVVGQREELRGRWHGA